MKKYYVMMALCLASAAGFSQSQSAVRTAATDPKRVENSAKADVSLIDKQTVTTTNSTTTTATEKRKKARRERVHKECSRMKS